MNQGTLGASQQRRRRVSGEEEGSSEPDQEAAPLPASQNACPCFAPLSPTRPLSLSLSLVCLVCPSRRAPGETVRKRERGGGCFSTPAAARRGEETDGDGFVCIRVGSGSRRTGMRAILVTLPLPRLGDSQLRLPRSSSSRMYYNAHPYPIQRWRIWTGLFPGAKGRWRFGEMPEPAPVLPIGTGRPCCHPADKGRCVRSTTDGVAGHGGPE